LDFCAPGSAKKGLLAMFGAMLITAAYVIEHPAIPQPPAVEILLFDNKNNYNVSNNPPRLAEFAISKAHYVISIWDYHWNQGQGATPGNINLQGSDGTIYGPWEVTAPDKSINAELGMQTTCRNPCRDIYDSRF
jgi:hypothetical protein